MSDQNSWRYCGKCHGLFYDGYPEKGSCPSGGGHEALGWNFRLLYDIPGSPTAQTDWRFCGKCNGLFFDGYPDKGACPASRAHSAIGFDFVLPHEIPGTPNDQPDWRFCGKCHGLFFDGYPDKGKCPSGGGHQAQGYNFVLPHWITPSVILERVEGADRKFFRASGWGLHPELRRDDDVRILDQRGNGRAWVGGRHGKHLRPRRLFARPPYLVGARGRQRGRARRCHRHHRRRLALRLGDPQPRPEAPQAAASSARALRTRASCFFGCTLGKTRAILPFGSMMKVERSIPMYFLPYIDFSPQAPYLSATL